MKVVSKAGLMAFVKVATMVGTWVDGRVGTWAVMLADSTVGLLVALLVVRRDSY